MGEFRVLFDLLQKVFAPQRANKLSEKRPKMVPVQWVGVAV